MPAQVSYPGVYVVEESSGARAIAGVATSICAFVGMAERGPMARPVRVFSIAEFERQFGAVTTGELGDQVRQFFLNGGGQAYISRIADGAVAAQVILRSEGGDDALLVTARDPGLEGNLIRVEIDYATGNPERTFNVTLLRSRLLSDGTRSREEVETFAGVSMDPDSGAFIETAINGVSALAEVEVLVANAPATRGVSISGLVLPTAAAAVETTLDPLVTPATRAIRVAVAHNPPVTVPLSLMADIVGAGTPSNIATAWTGDINNALTANSIAATVAVDISATGFAAGGIAGGRLLTIASTDGPVVVTPAAGADATTGLMLGSAAGGIEGDNFGDFRPAQTGVSSRNGTAANNYEALRRFAGTNRDQITGFNLVDTSPDTPHGAAVVIALGGAVAMAEDGGVVSLNNAAAVLDVLAGVLDANTSDRWTVRRRGLRLTLTPRFGNDNTGPGTVLTTQGGFDVGAANQLFANAANPANVADLSVGQVGGVGGAGPFQTGSVAGVNGNVPQLDDYQDAFDALERDIDLFNLMVLPRALDQTDAQRQALWGPASAFCARERAFLIVDPRSDWTDITTAEQGVDQIRVGVETRNAAAYWPRIRIADGTPAGRILDPSGSVAGIMARTDGARGVWKAPAGLEATVRGVVGAERRMSDPENGVINPKALNAIRVFPAGLVVWGARTLVGFDGSGNIDDKYVPVRRTMLFIEESLYRGLHFAVFEPNDEPLWAQIRLAAGSFMNGLFRQGAFAGAKSTDAYFVQCDSSTTTATDINLGIVNVIVGFAPLKPAEFVVLIVRQIAGQVQI
ncbi:MAG: phage tail sheath family protein [Allosphingosinicella sp.]